MGAAGAAATSDDASAGWALAGPPQVLNGILFRTRTGVPWRDVPDRYGPWETLYKRFARWQTDGTWARIQASLHTQADAAGAATWPPG